MNSIAENIRAIRGRMAAAAEAAGRDPEEILLVGASKMNGAEACRAAIAGGIDALGENRVQEMTEKLGQHAYDGAPLHFIGHLQRNKVRQVVGRASLIHSAGSLELLAEIDRQAGQRGLRQDVLLEVNIGGEASKSGFAPELLADAAAQAEKLLEEARRQADALVGEARQKAAQEGERLAAQAAARMDGAAALIVERIVGAT